MNMHDALHSRLDSYEEYHTPCIHIEIIRASVPFSRLSTRALYALLQ